TPAGEPLGVSFSDVAFKVPLAFAMWPSEFNVPSKSAKPATPSVGSTSADWERSSLVMVTFPCTGVREVSVELIGPALPSTFKLPPPGSWTETITGNALAKEKLLTVTLTLSYEIGLRLPVVDPSVMVPSVRSSLATLTFAGALGAFAAAVAGCAADCFPRDEKFQTPSRSRSKLISG